eukprot:scaffold76778_cov60-Attheya_sp.AAC.3
MMPIRSSSITTSALEGFKIEVIKHDSPFRQDAFRVISESFVDEPASMSLLPDDRVLRSKGWIQFVNHFVDECSTNEMSVACIDQTTQKVVACLILRDFSSPLPALVEEVVTKWNDPEMSKRCDYIYMGPLLEALVDVDTKYLEKRHPNGLKSNVVVDFWMGGTDVDYRNRGLLKQCLVKSIELAREKGFKYGVGECTGAFSARALRSVGATSIVATEYATFKVSNGQVGLNVEPPNTHLEIFEHNL